ncbi:MAG: arginine decarboxylase, pyruvoyl-dependent [Candidatus Hydrothermota bacterium]|nr:MAG: arginine decarboxylase, pyruvoyl-dependent [Candidatus Hydrothermae bacterium]
MQIPLYGKLERYFVTAGVGHGKTLLTAFDSALRAAGVGDYNLLKVSSIIPPGARKVDFIGIPKGQLLPIAYGVITSDKDGEVISAAVAVGIPAEKDSVGVIMEFAAKLPKKEVEKVVRDMAEEALRARGAKVKSIEVRSVSVIVKGPTCAFAGVALW